MQALKFTGNGFEYFKIWIVNVLLTIVTLTLYHPWAKVRNQRYFYGNTTLQDRNFEYHATGKQLFVGYLISMALLIAYLVLTEFSPTIAGIMILVLFLAVPWIVWRSIMFNMRVSSFSNVRFSFNGTVGGAYYNYLLLPIMVFLAIYGVPIIVGVVFSMLPEGDFSMGGVAYVLIFAAAIAWFVLFAYAYAFMKKSHNSYYINGSAYGQGEFETMLEVAPLAKIIMKSIAVFMAVLFILSMLIGLYAAASGLVDALLGFASSMDDPEAQADIISQGGVLSAIILMYLAFIIAGLVSFSYSFVRQRKYILSKSRLDNKMAFASTLSARGFIWLTVSNFLLLIVSLGLATPWIKVRIHRYLVDNTLTNTGVDIDEYVTQQQAHQSSLGDQIGDAFDVDVGIGI